MFKRFYLFLIFIIFIIIISIFVKTNEKFNNDFDKILDYKCRILNPSLNNYLGPWDNSTGMCSQYTCPRETCGFIRKDDRIISPRYGADKGYTWDAETFEQTMTNDANNNVVCSTRHNTKHPVFNTTMNCEQVTHNDPNHNRVEDCHTFDKPDKVWKKNTYIKLLNQDGVYAWYDKHNTNIRKSEQEVLSCRKEAQDCSSHNQYCCEMPFHPDPCLNRHKTNKDKWIEYKTEEIEGQDGTEYVCEPVDTCGVDNCRNTISETTEKRKDCWKFNTGSREWTNDAFFHKFVGGECGYYNKDNIMFSQMFYTNNVCRDTAPTFTNESCARNNPNITCGFLDPNENYYTKAYMPKVDYRGDKCIFETETGNDVLFQNGSVYTIPKVLNENDVCPPLTPDNCKDPQEYFLRDLGLGETKQCVKCPEGSFRNDDMTTTYEYLACTPNATCVSLNECDDRTCEKCLTGISVHNEMYQIVHLEQTPDRDQCVTMDDSHCEKRDDGTNAQCLPNKVVIVGNDRYCDNCESGKALRFHDNEIKCDRTHSCRLLANKLCLDTNTLEFNSYKYENEIDKFTHCVWKPAEDDGPNLEHCITQCPIINNEQYHRVTDAVNGFDYCTKALENIDNNV
jgi:hypothetical protein